MAKASFATLAFAFVILAIAGSAYCNEQPFAVKGNVYCDTCRVLFVTKISQPVPGAEVELVCTNILNATETLRVKNTTDAAGKYEILATGEHEEDVCTITAVRSSMPNCQDRAVEINSARVDLSNDVGFQSAERLVNPIGFRIDVPAPTCIAVLKELGFGPLSPNASPHEEGL